MAEPVVAPGSRVSIQFRLQLEDGTIVDETGDEPLAFMIGDGTLVAGLEGLLIGLAAGAREHFTVAPEDAFGFCDPDNVHAIAREEFPDGMSLEPGTVIEFAAPSGEAVAGTVVSINDRTVSVDFNHPLAGRGLTFEVHVLSIA